MNDLEEALAEADRCSRNLSNADRELCEFLDESAATAAELRRVRYKALAELQAATNRLAEALSTHVTKE